MTDEVEIKDKFGRVIHRGKGLRVLRNYISRARRMRSKFSMNIDHRGWPIAVGLRRNKDSSGDLHISFGDCSYSNVHFGNYSLMHNTVSNWIKLQDIPTAYYSE